MHKMNKIKKFFSICFYIGYVFEIVKYCRVDAILTIYIRELKIFSWGCIMNVTDALFIV